MPPGAGHSRTGAGALKHHAENFTSRTLCVHLKRLLNRALLPIRPFNVAFGWVASWLPSIILLIPAPRCGSWRPLASPPLSPAAPTPRVSRPIPSPTPSQARPRPPRSASIGRRLARSPTRLRRARRHRRWKPVRCRLPRASASAPERQRFNGANRSASGAAVADARCSRRRRGHWSAEGGTPIVVAQGETAALLATRYGVPTDALLRANGFNVASQVQPGSRLVIPVYRAGGAPVVATHVPAGPAKAPRRPSRDQAGRREVLRRWRSRGRRQASGAGEAGAQDRSRTDEGRSRPRSRSRRQSRAGEDAVKAEPRIAAATPARAVKTERIARGPRLSRSAGS